MKENARTKVSILTRCYIGMIMWNMAQKQRYINGTVVISVASVKYFVLSIKQQIAHIPTDIASIFQSKYVILNLFILMIIANRTHMIVSIMIRGFSSLKCLIEKKFFIC